MKNSLILLIVLTFYSCSQYRNKPIHHESFGPKVIDDLISSSDEKEYSFDLNVNNKVRNWIEYFTERQPERFQRYMNRGLRYKDVVMATLEEHELPSELYYLAMIESGYSRHARSHASAVGVWQFIRGTGKSYKLKIDSYIDERRDPIRATEAAAKYLRDLYNKFNSWELAAAAYNCGEGRVSKAIRRGKTRDFWELSRKRLLPPETRNYIPKLIAAIIVGEDPEKFGLEEPKLDENNLFPSVDAVMVPSPLRLVDISKVSGISYAVLKDVNPHLVHGFTSPQYKNYELWVPSSEKDKLETQLVSLKAYVKNSKSYIAKVDERVIHRVRKGENLSLIAKRYKESVRYIKKMNGLRSSRIYPGQKLRISSRGYKRPKPYSSHISNSNYRVRRGDNLSLIARRFGISWRKLKRINDLRSNKLRVGQILNVSSSNNKIKHRVRRGESLYVLARRYRTSIRNIKRQNNLKSNRLLVGMVLRIPRT